MHFTGCSAYYIGGLTSVGAGPRCSAGAVYVRKSIVSSGMLTISNATARMNAGAGNQRPLCVKKGTVRRE